MSYEDPSRKSRAAGYEAVGCQERVGRIGEVSGLQDLGTLTQERTCVRSVLPSLC